ncbi:MAG: hypothetical protein IJ060_07415 [Oscillospiraceae bacterium]|nr:hypothetical protein [Oscillospiraceae bacterium]
MNKLLSFEFRNAFKLLYVKLLPLIFLLFGILCGILNGNNGDGSMDGLPSICAALFEIVTVIGGMVMSKDFTQNTIRNKIIVGHSRTKIYLAKQILLTVIYLLNTVFLYAGYVITTKLTVTEDPTELYAPVFNKTGFLKASLIIFCSVLSLSLVAAFLTMSVKAALGGILPVLALYTNLFICTLADIFYNAKLLGWITDALPFGRMMMMTCSEPYAHTLRCCILMLCVGAASFAGGIMIFRKTNLN